MGCPVSKIIKCEAGARWLLDPPKIYEMVSAVVEAVNKPVTVKMRIGWDDEHIYAVENAKMIEKQEHQQLQFTEEPECRCMKVMQTGMSFAK